MRFVSRVLVPFLILSLPIAAVIAVILARQKAAVRKAAPPQAGQAVSFGDSQWPIFRGNPQLTGTAPGDLPESLAIVWSFKTGGPVRSSPVVAAGRVYVTSADKNIYALDAASGSRVWQTELEGEIEAPALAAGDAVYVGTMDGVFYALSASDGSQRWSRRTQGKIVGSANLAGDHILFGSYDGRLHAQDADGRVLWTYETDSYINGTPAVTDTAAVLGGCDAWLHIVPLGDPDNVRQIDAGSYIPSSPAVRDGRGYVGNFEGRLLCADLQTGQIVWAYDNPDESFFAVPAVSEEFVVIGSRRNKVIALDRASGQVQWTFTAEDAVNSSPVLCGSKVLFGCDDGFLRMVNLADGRLVWSMNLGRPILSAPAIADNRVLIGCDDGYVYAFAAEPLAETKTSP